MQVTIHDDGEMHYSVDGASGSPMSTPLRVGEAAPDDLEELRECGVSMECVPREVGADASLDPNDSSSLKRFLAKVSLLCTLNEQQLASLSVLVREFDELDIILDGDTKTQHVMVVVRGSVEVFSIHKAKGYAHRRIGSVEAPSVLCLEPAILNYPTDYRMCAGAARTAILLVHRDALVRCLAQNATFSYAIGSRIVHGHYFAPHQLFFRSVFTGHTHSLRHAQKGYILDLHSIRTAYRAINTQVHPLMNSSEIDWVALEYATRRLPTNLTNSSIIVLSRARPELYWATASTDTPHRPKFVPTRNRRRSSWELASPSSTVTLVQMREFFTDVADVVTCMCMFLEEVGKILGKMRACNFTPLEVLSAARQKMDESSENDAMSITQEAFTALKFTDAEQQILTRIWGDSVIPCLYGVMVNHEHYSIRLGDATPMRFIPDVHSRWASSIHSDIATALGLPPTSPLPPDVALDILTCNTQSARSLLCSPVMKQREALLQWAAENLPDLHSAAWQHESDLLYYIFARRLAAEETAGDYATYLKEAGFTSRDDLALTGLRVDVINVDRLSRDFMDPDVQSSWQPKGRHFIVSVDFAFGAQTDAIMRALILELGPFIRSINVVGKLTGLVGSPGDVSIPTEMVFAKSCLGDDTMDTTMPTPHNRDLSMGFLTAHLPRRTVHVGGVVTIPGIVMLNDAAMRFYRIVHNCVGMEMEGGYYARQVEESINQQLLNPSVRARFAYYTADVLDNGRGVTLDPQPVVRVPPIYTLNKAMLRAILSAP